MRIGPAVNVARLNVAEEITALWSFVNALGLLTDVIGERTGGAGVTIEGVQFRDTAAGFLGLASAANRILGSDVVGDVDERFRLHAGGIMQWGDGTGARDTNLFRQAADTLRTDDSFTVGGVLGLLGNIGVSDRIITLIAGANDDVDTGTVTLQRLDATAGAANITGLAGGFAGRLLVIVNVTSNAVTLNNNDVGSVAANRMFLPNAADLVLSVSEALWFYYDFNTPIWQAIAFV